MFLFPQYSDECADLCLETGVCGKPLAERAPWLIFGIRRTKKMISSRPGGKWIHFSSSLLFADQVRVRERPGGADHISSVSDHLFVVVL